MLLAQNLLWLVQLNLRIYGILTNILIKPGKQRYKFDVSNSSCTKKFLFKLFLTVLFITVVWLVFLNDLRTLTFNTVIQTVFYQIAISFHIPIVWKLYSNRFAIVDVFNSLITFEKRNNGKYYIAHILK